MAEFNGMDPRHQNASVLRMLEELQGKEYPQLHEVNGEKKEELSQEELDTKLDLLDKLESSLLPSVKDQLCTLLTALDLQRDRIKHPSPDCELTLQTIKMLDQTIEETMGHLEAATRDTVSVPLDTHDQHLKRCKNFRFVALLEYITSTMEAIHLELFSFCDLFIRTLVISGSNPKNERNQEAARRMGGVVLELTDECSQLIDRMVRLSRASDLSFLQAHWQEKVELLDKRLGSLATIIAYEGPRSALRMKVITMARPIVTLIKLLRTLWSKTTQTPTRKLPLILAPQLNSETLSPLCIAPQLIFAPLSRCVDVLLDSHRRNAGAWVTAEMRESINAMTRVLELDLVRLPQCLLPIPSGVDHWDFEAWLLVWKPLWYSAKDHFLASLVDPDPRIDIP
ncbi:hypothetical protein, variant [Puccinia striiformis f. sp. tritici PST-78]|uniref:Uncharacterized protein n=1 Tax=Puccinia striiformis f. sp. tritici PST-78 TaxID=1165861 RepID=A0A0L0VDG4_9BASI|nr:hypothetical protein, variant [Puccinia striiformis f. sp. tritici PST-78]